METATIEQSEWLPAKPVQVYDAFVNARKHAEFTGAAATCEPVAGGPFTARDGYISGTTPKDDGTEVTMVHSSVPVSQVEAYRQDYYWNPLKKYFVKT
jgi:hypothetical protein